MITESQAKEARQRLVKWFWDVFELLRRLATEGHDPKGIALFSEEMLRLVQAAWVEFERDFDFDRAVWRIQDLSPQRIQTAGLYGSQLALKLAVIERAQERFFSVGGRPPLRGLLGRIDTLLDSLIGATGIPEAIKELKEMLGYAAED